MTSGQIQPESGECWGWQQMAPALRLGPVADPAPIAEPDQWHWLLVRRSIADPEDLAYCACFGVGKVSLAEPARVVGARWIIEDAFKAAKQEVGRDEYEARRWVGWYRHVTLALLAHAFLAATRRYAAAGDGKGGRRSWENSSH